MVAGCCKVHITSTDSLGSPWLTTGRGILFFVYMMREWLSYHKSAFCRRATHTLGVPNLQNETSLVGFWASRMYRLPSRELFVLVIIESIHSEIGG